MKSDGERATPLIRRGVGSGSNLRGIVGAISLLVCCGVPCRLISARPYVGRRLKCSWHCTLVTPTANIIPTNLANLIYKIESPGRNS